MYHALSFNVNILPGSPYVNMVYMALMDFPALLLNMVMLNWKHTGRRTTSALTMVAAGVSSFLVVPFIATGW